MNQAEFQKLARETYSFNQLPIEQQKEILQLEGNMRAIYAKNFELENRQMVRAIEEFRDTNAKVVHDLKTKARSGDLKAHETEEKLEKESKLNNLLNDI